jgi:D-alanine-D-alanine ligase
MRARIVATGHEYVFIEADEDFVEKVKALKPDLVFNRAEGLRGDSRESHVPAILEMLGIPYVGSNVLTTAIGLNKAWAKKILTFHGILTPKFDVCKTDQEVKSVEATFPCILKPNEEGSSIGITEDNIVYNKKQLLKRFKQMREEYQQHILIEEFIEGREFSTGLLGKPSQDPEVLSILEIDFARFSESGLFGQQAKTILDSLDHYICPAQIPNSLKKRLERLSINIWDALDIKDFARIDFRMNDKGELFFLEINPLPGMDFDTEKNDLSFYPYMAMKSGYSYDELVRRILESACARYGITL